MSLTTFLVFPPLALFQARRRYHGIISSFFVSIEAINLITGMQQGSVPVGGILFLHSLLVLHAFLVTRGIRSLKIKLPVMGINVHRPSRADKVGGAYANFDHEQPISDSFEWIIRHRVPTGLLFELSYPFRRKLMASESRHSVNREGSSNGGLFSKAKCGICGEPNQVTRDQIKSMESPAPDHHDCTQEAHSAIQQYLDVLKALWFDGVFNKDHFSDSFNRVYRFHIHKSFGRSSDVRQDVLLLTMRIVDQLLRSLYQPGPVNPAGVAALISFAAWFSDTFVTKLERPAPTDETNTLELHTRWASTIAETRFVSDFLHSSSNSKTLDQIIGFLFSKSTDSANRSLAFHLEQNEVVLAQAIIGYRLTTSRSVRDFISVSRTAGGKYRSNTTHWDWGVSTTSGSISPRNRTTESRTVSSSYRDWSDVKDAHIVVTTRQIWFQTLDKIYAGTISYSNMGMLSATEDGFHFLRTKSQSNTEAFVESPYIQRAHQDAIAPLIGEVAQAAFHDGLAFESRINQLIGDIENS